MRCALLTSLAGVALLALAPTADAGRCSSGVSVSFSYGSRGCGYGYGVGYHARLANRSCAPRYRSCYRPSPRVTYVYRDCRPRYSHYTYYRPTVQTYTRDGWLADRSVDEYRAWQVATEGAASARVAADDKVRRIVVVPPAEKSSAEARPAVVVVSAADWDGAREALAEGNFATARDAYAELAESNPNLAAPKVGYAISSALLGDEKVALRAMRRALLAEPEAFGPDMISETTHERLDQLSRVLRAVEPEELEAGERWTLIASIDHLRGEVDESRAAISEARALGEDHLSAKNLWRLVGLSEKPLERVEVAER